MTHTKSGLQAAVICLAALLLPSLLPAQITFERTYGGTADDFGQCALQTRDGGYLITGWTCSSGAGAADAWMVRTDSQGDTLWTRTYGYSNDDVGQSVLQTADGGYILAGYTFSMGAGHDDLWLVKTDSLANTLWTKTYGGAGWDAGFAVEQTSDLGYVITGSSSSFGSGVSDVYLVRTDAGGDTLWTRTFGGPYSDGGLSVQQTSDHGFIVTGYTQSFGAGYEDVWLIKTDDLGDSLWTRTFGGRDYERGNSVQQTSNGGYVVVGNAMSFGAGQADVWLIRTDSAGMVQWTKTYGGGEYDWGLSVQQTSDGNNVIAGHTYSFGAGWSDVWLIKTDALGETLWTRTFGDTSFDEGCCVRQAADRGFVIAGYTGSFGAGESDFLLVKTNPDGNVAVAEPKASPQRAPVSSLTCEPNPFRGSTTISLSPYIPLSLSSVLRLFDAQGRLVLSRPVSTSPFVLSTSDLPSGIYVARLDCGTHHASARLVVQR